MTKDHQQDPSTGISSRNLSLQREPFDGIPLRSFDLLDDPIVQFGLWYEEAEKSCRGYPNPVSLATADTSGQPVVRTVLLKGFSPEGFVFFTNYQSRKARHMLDNPKASMCFFWEEMERQVIVIGSVVKTSQQASDAYFATRPRGSQLGAHVSSQSQAIDNRSVLEQELIAVTQRYQQYDSVPRPENWGGYELQPQSIEFWQGQPNRLHDRFLYERDQKTGWHRQRLAP